MPVDSSIALQIKPPVIEPVDFGKQFLTLSQLRYLGARTQAAEQEAARTQTTFDEAGAFRQRLSSLGTVPASPASPAAAGGDPAGSPAPGAAPAARRRSILDPDVQAELYSIAPHAADDLLKTGLATHTSTLEAQQKLYESVARSLPTGDEASYQAWRTMASTLLPPEMAAHLPEHDPGEAGRAQMQRNAQDLGTQFKQQIETSTAEAARITAKATETQAETARQRLPIEQQQATSGAVLAGAAKTTAEAAKTAAESYEVIPTGDGFVRFRKATGEIDRQSGMGLTQPQAAKVQELNTQYMGENKNFLESRDAYGRSKEGFAQNTGPGDIMGMYGWGKVADPGAIVQPGQMAHMEQVGTAWQGFWKEYNRLVSDPSARLDPTVRQHYLETLETTHARQVADHQKNRTETQKRGRTLLPGIDPDLYAPDLTSTATPSTPAAPGTPPRANLAPPPPGAKVEAVKSVSLKELQQTVDLANKQGRKTPTGQRFTLDYLKEYFTQNGVEVRP